MKGARCIMTEEGGATRTSATFSVDFTRFMNPDGSLCGPLPDFAEDTGGPDPAFTATWFALRAFDAKAVALQRTGRLGTLRVVAGPGGVSRSVSAAAMTADDVLLPSFREQGARSSATASP